MRALLRGVVVKVVGITVGVGTVPILLVIGWWAASSTRVGAVAITPLTALGVIVGLAAYYALVGVVIGFRQVGRVIDLFLPALNAMIGQAERVEQGAKAPPTAPTGVEEFDRLGAALSRGARVAANRLAAERDFAADASHQLRTPLTALLMRIEEIAATDDLGVVGEEAGLAIAQVERLSSVVDDLLGRSRAGAEEVEEISLDSVLAALQREWQLPYAAARRTIHVTGERDLRVCAAPGALAQIMSTLLENSLQHGAGTVSVLARRSGPSVVVEVSDEGEGIPPAMAPRVFERSVSSQGSGLGLTLARDLAAAQGGRLELVNPVGAVFALFLSGPESR